MLGVEFRFHMYARRWFDAIGFAELLFSYADNFAFLACGLKFRVEEIIWYLLSSIQVKDIPIFLPL